VTSAEPVSFVLVSTNAPPDPVQVIEAATQLGVPLAHEMGDPDTLNFRIETGGTLIVALMPVPHPDAVHMPVGPTSPEPETIDQHVGHYIVTAFDLPDDPVQTEVTMSIVTAALVQCSPAVAVKLGDGAIFHRADFFATVVETADGGIATEITVDITAAQEGADRVSFLTHGLAKYDREEFYMTSSVTGTGALEYLMQLVRWMVTDPDKVLPTGDIIGPTDKEPVMVQRAPSPIEGKPPVIRLDMDTDKAVSQPPRPKKKGWFRRS
jgi:hypothetical protein